MMAVRRRVHGRQPPAVLPPGCAIILAARVRANQPLRPLTAQRSAAAELAQGSSMYGTAREAKALYERLWGRSGPPTSLGARGRRRWARGAR
eukprot:SAG25_NODE_97_length_15788_cov_5.361910_18_plen_92_part_00